MGFRPRYSSLRVSSAKFRCDQTRFENKVGIVLRLEDIVESRHAFDTGGANFRATIAQTLHREFEQSYDRPTASKDHGDYSKIVAE